MAKNHYIKNDLSATGLLIIIAILTYAMTLGLNIFLANYMSIRLYGEYNLTFRIMLIASSLVLLGTANSAKKFFSLYQSQQDQQTLYRYVAWNFRLLIKSSLLFLSFVVAIFVGLYLLNIFDAYKDHYLLIAYGLFATPLYAINLLFVNYIASKNSPILATFLKNAFVNIILLLLFFIAASLGNVNKIDEHIVLATWLIGFLLLTIISIAIIGFKIPYFLSHSVKHLIASQRDEKEKVWLKTSLTMIMANLFFFFTMAVDLLSIKIIRPHPHSLAFYSAALTISAFIWSIPLITYNLVKPRIAVLIQQENGQQQLQQTLNTIFNASLTMAIITGIVIMALSHYLLLAFGKSYNQADVSIALLLLVIAACINIIGTAAMSVLIYSDYEGLALKLTSIELVLIVSLTLLFTYLFGIVGTAMATLINSVVKSLISTTMVRKKLALKSIGIF